MLPLVLLALLFPSGAQQPATAPAPPSADAVELRAHAWLLAAYPSLRRGDLGIRVYGSGDVQRLEIVEEPTAAAPGTATRTPFGTIDLLFNRAGYLEGMRAEGRFVRSAANATVKAQVDAHPAWTLTDVDSAIKAAGGQYPSTAKAALVAQAPALVKILRRDATLVGSALVKTADGPLWVVEVATATRSYRLAFEPLSGQLVRVAAK